jgi:hypothetical protein
MFDKVKCEPKTLTYIIYTDYTRCLLLKNQTVNTLLASKDIFPNEFVNSVKGYVLR